MNFYSNLSQHTDVAVGAEERRTEADDLTFGGLFHCGRNRNTEMEGIFNSLLTISGQTDGNEAGCRSFDGQNCDVRRQIGREKIVVLGMNADGRNGEYLATLARRAGVRHSQVDIVRGRQVRVEVVVAVSGRQQMLQKGRYLFRGLQQCEWRARQTFSEIRLAPQCGKPLTGLTNIPHQGYLNPMTLRPPTIRGRNNGS